MSQTITLTKPVFTKVKELHPGDRGFNVYLRVVELNTEKVTKADGGVLEVADALCGDETGCVRVRAIGENAPKIKLGSVISVRNGRSEVFKEKMRLEVDRWGKIQEETNVNVGEVDRKNNLSETSYEVKIVRFGGRGGSRGGGRGGRGGRRGGRGGRGGYGGREDFEDEEEHEFGGRDYGARDYGGRDNYQGGGRGRGRGRGYGGYGRGRNGDGEGTRRGEPRRGRGGRY